MLLKEDNPDFFTREEKTKMKDDFRGALSVWLRALLGDRSFVYALLRHGIFNFCDMRKCADFLRQGTCADGGILQSARHAPNPELRSLALHARKQQKDAKKWAMWASKGWHCSDFQETQIMLLETGELARQVRDANAAYGFGKGAEQALTREQAMTFKVFTSDVLDAYMK